MKEGESLVLGLSPCPNDTFIFHALLHGLVRPDWPDFPEIKYHMADVEQLNELARAGKMEVSKISLGAIPDISENYALLSSGAALGWACGPLIVSKRPPESIDFTKATVAIPGRMTTASLLLDLHGGFQGPRQEMLFSDIMPAVAADKADLGVIIHEGRFTYARQNLHKVLDLGQWWEETRAMPLPLGAIVVRRDLQHDMAKAMEKAIAASLAWAWEHPDDSRQFIKSHAQEMEDAVIDAHIKTFVTPFSLDLGEQGRQAISELVQGAMAIRGLPPAKNLFLD